jgi:hypothetical protein
VPPWLRLKYRYGKIISHNGIINRKKLKKRRHRYRVPCVPLVYPHRDTELISSRALPNRSTGATALLIQFGICCPPCVFFSHTHTHAPTQF